jgi:hypothetical protein
MALGAGGHTRSVMADSSHEGSLLQRPRLPSSSGPSYLLLNCGLLVYRHNIILRLLVAKLFDPIVGWCILSQEWKEALWRKFALAGGAMTTRAQN